MLVITLTVVFITNYPNKIYIQGFMQITLNNLCSKETNWRGVYAKDLLKWKNVNVKKCYKCFIKCLESLLEDVCIYDSWI